MMIKIKLAIRFKIIKETIFIMIFLFDTIDSLIKLIVYRY